MFSGLRLFSIILIIIAFFLLIIFSFIKYNQVDNSEYNQVVHSAEKGEKNLYAFLDYIKKIDWLNLDKKDIIEINEDELFKIETIEKVKIEKIVKQSFSLVNWQSLWHNYWQTHINWINEELENIKNK